MKKIIVTILMVFAMIGSAMGYVVDGNLNDWGVDLTQSWGSFSTWDVADADIDFIVEDNIDPRLDTAYWVNQKLACDWTCYFGYDDFCSCNYGIHKSTFNGNTNNYVEPFVYSKGKDDYNGDGRMTPPTTGELYDNEALYCDNDANNIYLAIVTSFPKNGANARIDTTTYYNQGDIGFDFNNDGYMEYGIKVKGSNEGKICKNPKWTAVDKDEDNWKSETEPFYWEFSCTNTNSQWTGTGSISYVDQGFNENENDILGFQLFL